jgi:Zn-dependent peptidase ImmA (M78 family)
MNKPQSLTADYDEYAANKLAAAILMPKEVLEMVYKFCFNNKYIERINTVYDRENYHLFVSIAKLLGVSREALSIRLKDLGMLGEYRYMTISEIIDVYVEDVA